MTGRESMRVKICGITNLDDARCAAEAGADMLGFICTNKSPRYVEPWQAFHIIDSLRAEFAGNTDRLPKMVGVFVDMPPADIRQVMDRSGFDYVQLHGAEPRNDLLLLRRRAFKAVRPRAEDIGLLEAMRYGNYGMLDGPRLLVDAYSAKARGGTGELADWDLAAIMASRIPNVLLAGGLTPDNVAEAIRMVRPWGVDASSGLEFEPGSKDHDAIRRFVLAAKNALY